MEEIKRCAVCNKLMPRKPDERLVKDGWSGMSFSTAYLHVEFVFCPKHNDPSYAMDAFNKWHMKILRSKDGFFLTNGCFNGIPKK